MKIRATFLLTVLLLAPLSVHAQIDGALDEIRMRRVDLQDAFDATTQKALPGSKAGFLIDLKDWAEQYGWREFPELSRFVPTSAFVPERTVLAPEPEVSASSYIVIDRRSRQVLAAQHADQIHPAASLTKLVSADVLLSRGVPLTSVSSIHAEDAVDGAMLAVKDGEEFTVDALLYAALTASANNAANALARAAGLSKTSFVDEMNLRAASLNLTRTHFVDPSGIDPANVTTPREAARFAEAAFARSEVRRYTSTAQIAINMLTSGGTKKLKSTNWMLYYPEYDDIFIMSGKTGYLDEAGWNLVVSIRPAITDLDRELLIVTFDSSSRADSFKDARALAQWAWESHAWKPNK